MSNTFAIGSNPYGQMIFLIRAEGGWKIKNMVTGSEVLISESQLALAHHVAQPK